MPKPRAQFSIEAAHRRGPPLCPPDPRFPDGVHVAARSFPACRVELPYPAPERLVWVVKCNKCEALMLVTAAGRPDDPRSVEVPCRLLTH